MNKKNMAQKKEEREFIFPQHILSQLSECSAGGFLLFSISDRGEVIPYASFESEIAARAIIDFCGDFTKSFKEINSSNMLNNMAESLGDEDDEEFGESEL